MPADLTALAAAVRWAAERLNSEEHRYVERFAPCPNGCLYGYADGYTIAGEHRDWPTNQVPMLALIAGPNDCTLCDGGTIEDESAPWIDEQLALLRAAADTIATTPRNGGRGLDALIPPKEETP